MAWSWKFFAERIPYEESLLLDMFGTEYQKYAERTRIGLPFIKSPIQLT
jgi:protein-S-isoprenylcysteine O-methyltransferase